MWYKGLMGRKVRFVFRHLFLLYALLSLALFFLVEGLARDGSTEAARALAGPMRVLIVPMYLVWMLLTMVQVALFGPVGKPLGPFVAAVQLVASLAPFALADYVLDRCRAIIRKVAASNDKHDR